MRTTTSDVEAGYPAANGWTIDNLRYKYGSTAWAGAEQPAILHIAAASKAPKLTVSNITATGATLTIANHTTAWYYKATSGPHTACQSAVAAGTDNKAISGLTAGTSYTYSAYSDNGCSTLLATAAPFTTSVTLTSSSVTATTATLTIAGHTGDWYYQHTTPSNGTCSSTAETTDSANLTGLTANTNYIFAAYSDSQLLDAAGHGVAVHDHESVADGESLTHVSGNTYTLHAHDQRLDAQQGRQLVLQARQRNTIATPPEPTTISGNGGIYQSGTSYTYTAYSGYPCTSTNLIATAPAVTAP